MKKIISIISFTFATFALSGCFTEELKTLVTFHTGTSVMGLPETNARELVEMPSSGTRVMCGTDIFMYSGDLERVDVAQVKVDGIEIYGFYFRCSMAGSKKLFSMTGSNLNNYIVMKINGKPMGLRKVDTVIADGLLFVIADVPEVKGVSEMENLQKIADEINESIQVSDKIKKDL